jgi:hypothetical protein
MPRTIGSIGGLAPRTRAHHILRLLLATVLALVVATVGTTTVSADEPVSAPADGAAILDWNRNAYRVFAERSYPPPAQALLGGFVATAVFDAVNAIEGGFESYAPVEPGAAGASVDAAVATAAYDVLVALGPTTAQLDADLAASLASVADPAARAAGVDVGHDAAAAFMATRAGDGRFDTSIMLQTTAGPGVWDVPPSGMTAAWLGFVRPLAVPNQTWIRLGGPDPLTSAEYAADFAEVKATGSKTGSTRTPGETETALFYSVNPFPQYNAALRDRFVRHHGATGGPAIQMARAFAIANMAMADAAIAGFRVKFDVHNWRPQQAIQRADTDGNPATTRQDGWEPLVPNPAYGDYVSGHAVASGAFLQAAARLFGPSNLDLIIGSSATGTTRHYQSAAHLKRDTENARIWSGLHFRKAMDDGNRVGRKTADYVMANEFRPLR